ncbi:glycosyltransferase [Neobacillus niacini]|uniref:glycosyltransferase family 4 protein n=1 Tax=Neobacillus niacini TaxID=86668 RepID=UPI0028664A1B|nr:glycosyltransferase [Neobacillus niacini]MDR6999834.1 glycosyltransferase involved in cell wall biosynthesis [Neobacillus niacini]
MLFVFTVPAGGMLTLNIERNIALTRKGIECHFLYFNGRKDIDISNNGRIYITNKDNEIIQLIQELQIQAIIVCTYFEILKRLRKAGYAGKIIYEIQGIGHQQLTGQWLEKGKPVIAKYADAILYPSTEYLDKLMKKHFPNKKLFSFHNSIDSNLFHYKEVPKYNKTIVGWVGRLDYNKNWQEFLLIGAALSKRIQNVELWMFYDPAACSKEALKNFTRWINKLKLNDSIVLNENTPRDKMPYFYSRISKSNGLLCSTSRQEGFGYAVIEAMCCQCPVLTTRSGGVESFVIHNVTGKLYDQGDINNAVSEAKDLILNNNRKNEMITKAVHFIETFFSPDLYGKQFLHMLGQLFTING